jgi:D-beta-D-heptose 7-phosphate kinase/D-beta-D-heptose 1-phosphate adenosyltransferase
MALDELQSLLERIRGRRILCVGDLMVDRYVYGEVSRISPEAPIPVMLRRSEAVMLGGVGNVARNLAALGAQAALCGVIGDDPSGSEAVELALAEGGGVDARLVVDGGRPTITKTRFVAGGQQLLRLDAEESGHPTPEAERALAEELIAAAEGVGAILISDYAKGAISENIIAAAHAAGQASGAPVIVDPKGLSFAKYGPVDVIKPNAKELSLVVNLPVNTDEEAETALKVALEACTANAILVTRAGAGMSLAVRGKPVRHFRSRAQAVFDVSGAGDTCLAALGAGLAAGAELESAVRLAILASGVVVAKPGTAVVTPAELRDAELGARLLQLEHKLADLEEARSQVARWRAAGLRVGFTNGCFDILHRGHVAYLAQARSWCDRLVVGLNSDASIRRLKGESRPVNDLESRALVLAGLGSVDLVAPFEDDTPIKLIEGLRPDVLIKGADYTVETVVGSDLVLGYGGEVRLAPLVEGYSTTKAIARMGETG